MAIYTVNIQNEQYRRLLNDIVKVLSLLVVFYTYVSLYHRGDMKVLLDKKYLKESASLFVLAFMFYHLVVHELVEFV